MLLPKFNVRSKWQEETTTLHLGNTPGSPGKQQGKGETQTDVNGRGVHILQ